MSLNKNLSRLSRDQKASIVFETHTFNINIDTREIFIHGHIDDNQEDMAVDYRMANYFLKNIRLLEGLSRDKLIVIHQHSLGGDWDAGMIMYDAMKLCQAPVLFIMWGMAASMGSIIPQAADKRVIAPSCWFMVHEGSTDLNPYMTRKMARSYAKIEERQDEEMMNIYTSVCHTGNAFKNSSPKEIEKFIAAKMDSKEDWWLDAEEAVEYGFADGILGSEGFETPIDIRNNWEEAE
jgi:ATP-dependent Clp protease protease subunit